MSQWKNTRWQPAATTKPRTRGDSRISRTIPMASAEVPSPELECLARAVITRSWAADTTGLGTPTPLGMIQWRCTHHHSSLCLDDQLLNCQLWLVQRHVWEQQRFRVVQAELVRQVQAAMISIIMHCMEEMLVWQCCRIGCPWAKVDDRVIKVRCSRCPCIEVNWLGQACRIQCVLQLFEAGGHSHKHDAGGGNLSISTADVLKILTDEFSANDLEDGRYAPQQHTQGVESLPATTGEFNHMLNVVVHEVCQPRADEETSSVYTRHRAAQERLSQSVPMLREHVKAEPAAPPLVDSTYAHSQRWREEFHNCVMLQCLQLCNLWATSHMEVPDQNIIFDQNGIP